AAARAGAGGPDRLPGARGQWCGLRGARDPRLGPQRTCLAAVQAAAELTIDADPGAGAGDCRPDRGRARAGMSTDDRTDRPWEHGVWDTGLQPERTRLSWQRTALSSAACALIIARLVGEANPYVGITV